MYTTTTDTIMPQWPQGTTTMYSPVTCINGKSASHDNHIMQPMCAVFYQAKYYRSKIIHSKDKIYPVLY